jgi:thiamine-phosphate pyrophosphorylase
MARTHAEARPPQGSGGERRDRLAAARLYLVLGSHPSSHGLAQLVRAAAAGGVDVIQLRDKDLPDEQLLALAGDTQLLCSELGVLFIVNDRPHIARDAGADGVHVGQDDMAPVEVREVVGDAAIVGLSTHATDEIDAADPALVDYIGVGPVHATPTKPGRAAVGAELVRYAAANARLPFFAIGGLDAGNVREVLDAGATRVCVLRAIADAEDPQAAASELSAAIAGDAQGAPR